MKKLWKGLALLVSGGLLAVGMFLCMAIAGSKFGVLSGGRDGHYLRQSLRDLQQDLRGYHAGWGEYPRVPRCPAGTPEPAWCPDPRDAGGIVWKPGHYGAYERGEYWVDVDAAGASFVAHARYGRYHYVVGPEGEPEPFEE